MSFNLRVLGTFYMRSNRMCMSSLPSFSAVQTNKLLSHLLVEDGKWMIARRSNNDLLLLHDHVDPFNFDCNRTFLPLHNFMSFGTIHIWDSSNKRHEFKTQIERGIYTVRGSFFNTKRVDKNDHYNNFLIIRKEGHMFGNSLRVYSCQ